MPEPYVGREPVIWFHEVFRVDGTPIYEEEADLIKQITGKVKAKTARTQRPNIFRSLVLTETNEALARTSFMPAQLLKQMNVH